MTIEEIAKRLNECANKEACKTCNHSRGGIPTLSCEGYIIEEMGTECRKLVEQMGDDGK